MHEECTKQWITYALVPGCEFGALAFPGVTMNFVHSSCFFTSFVLKTWLG